MGEYDKATNDYDEAILRNVNNWMAIFNRGDIAFDQGDYEEALAYYEEAIRPNPEDAPMRAKRAEVLYIQREYDSAIADLDVVIRLEPEFVAAYDARARCWGAKEDYDKALADFNEAIRLDPGNVSAHLGRGGAWREKNEYAQAIADYDEAIRLDPDNAVAHAFRGDARREVGDHAQAIADYDEVLRLDPHDSWAPFAKMLTRLSMGSPEVVADAQAIIDRHDWEGPTPISAAIVGCLGARRVKNQNAAQAFLDNADAHADKSLWPYPIVQFLRREIDEKALLDQATDDEEKAEARCRLAFVQLLNGQTDQARESFQWVKDHRSSSRVETDLAAAELGRLEKKPTDGR